MTTVHQVIAGGAPGDAVTDQALRLQALLRGWGHRSEILAEHVHPAVARQVHRLTGPGDPMLHEGALILRYSIWSAAADAALAAGGPLAVIYHNVTPPEFLRAVNPAVAQLCADGRARLGRLRGRVAALVADSAFNAADLRDAGIGDATVVPLLLDGGGPPPPPRAATGTPDVLTVGRIVPNKRIEDVVRVVAAVQRTRAPGARLTVVGAADGFERYRDAVSGVVSATRAAGATFTGRVTDAERDRAFAAASVYLCMSVHEGFCLPLVEAMQRGVPVVARAAAAVPETLGDAGVCIPGDDPLLFSEAVWEVSRSARLRGRLAEAARDRLDDLRPDRVAPRLQDALAPVLAGAA